MVHFGRSVPPVDPPQQHPSTAPPLTAHHIEHQGQKGLQDLIIPPQFRKFCLMGFGAQVALDIVVLLVIYLRPAAFLYVNISTPTIPVACLCLVLDFAMLVWTYRATPRPIDVLMKNALSGVAWFMLAVINGSIIAEITDPYPPFIVCLLTFLVNIAFWCWTVWWGLNDRGPRSMYPQARAKRCFSCRNGGGMFSLHTHTHTRRMSMPRSFSPTEEANGIVLGRSSQQSTSAIGRMKETMPTTPTSPVFRESGGRVPLQARDEPALMIKKMPGVEVRGSYGHVHQTRQHSMASTLYPGDLEIFCVDQKNSSPV